MTLSISRGKTIHLSVRVIQAMLINSKISRAAISSIISFTCAFRMRAPSEKSPASLVFSTAIETGRSAKAGQFVPFKVSATIDYDLDRDLRAWTRAATREKLRARARAHIKSIFCHTLTRGCPNPNLIYDGTLNDRSLSRGGLCQRAASPTDVSVVSSGCSHLNAIDIVLDFPSCVSIHLFDLRSRDSRWRQKKCIHEIREPSKRSISFAQINLWK